MFETCGNPGITVVHQTLQCMEPKYVLLPWWLAAAYQNCMLCCTKLIFFHHEDSQSGSQQNLICPGPEIAWNLSQKVRKPGQNKKFCRKPGMLRYTKFQYYIETIFSRFCTPVNLECLWCLPFGANIVHTKNLEFYDLNKLETLVHVKL